MNDVADISSGKTLTTSEIEALVLKGGGGGGKSRDMEARVKVLEDTMMDVRLILARMEERMSHLATKEDVAIVTGKVGAVEKALDGKLGYWQFIGTGIGLIAVLLAALAFMMRPEVQAFIRGAPAS